jgi:hypothetical protein
MIGVGGGSHRAQTTPRAPTSMATTFRGDDGDNGDSVAKQLVITGGGGLLNVPEPTTRSLWVDVGAVRNIPPAPLRWADP